MKFILLLIPFVFYFGTGSQLSGTKWNLYSIQNNSENFKYVLNNKINSTIEFGDSLCEGNAACNGFGGNYKIEKELIVFGNLATTTINCSDDRRIVEDFIHRNFRKLFFKVESDTLTLFDQKGVFLKYTKKK